MDDVLKTLDAAHLTQFLQKYPIRATLQMVCRDHEVRDAEFVLRDCRVIPSWVWIRRGVRGGYGVGSGSGMVADVGITNPLRAASERACMAYLDGIPRRSRAFVSLLYRHSHSG